MHTVSKWSMTVARRRPASSKVGRSRGSQQFTVDSRQSGLLHNSRFEGRRRLIQHVTLSEGVRRPSRRVSTSHAIPDFTRFAWIHRRRFFDSLRSLRMTSYRVMHEALLPVQACGEVERSSTPCPVRRGTPYCRHEVPDPQSLTCDGNCQLSTVDFRLCPYWHRSCNSPSRT
jgi:hypothetical protein